MLQHQLPSRTEQCVAMHAGHQAQESILSSDQILQFSFHSLVTKQSQ